MPSIAEPVPARNRFRRAGFISASGGVEKAGSGRSVDLPTVSRQPSQFLLCLEATRGDGIRGLRALLKTALRKYGLRCIEAREERPTARQRHHRPEDAIQRAIVQHYRQRAAPGVFMFAVPNGGFRRPVEAAILKATVAGIPDTIWIKDGQVYALELKAPGGRLTPAQEEVLGPLVLAHDLLSEEGSSS
jgi:hypothetical protein